MAAIGAVDPAVEIVALGGDRSSIPQGLERTPEPAHLPTNAGWNIVGLPRAAAAAKVDLIHAPAYTGPFWSPVPVVLTVHDVSYALHPEWYPYRVGPARQWFYRRSALNATRILTVSRFSAGEIARAYAIPEARITVAPLGVDAFFTPGGSNPSVDLPAGVTGPYLLHVGDIHERRNLTMFLRAFEEVRQAGEITWPLSLVLVGVDRGVVADLRRRADEAGFGPSVIHLEHVSEQQLRALYRGATALVYPSLYEGFGLPLIEAMACGTPVIGSTAASIPEVAGDAALLIEPTDTSQWVAAITKVANDDRTRWAMKSKGLTRAATFTWERTARLTLDGYREAIGA